MKPWHEKSKTKDPALLRQRLIEIEKEKGNDWVGLWENDHPKGSLTIFGTANLTVRTTHVLVRPYRAGKGNYFDKWRKYIELWRIHVGDHKHLYILQQHWHDKRTGRKVTQHIVESYHDIKEVLREFPSKEVGQFLREIRP